MRLEREPCHHDGHSRGIALKGITQDRVYATPAYGHRGVTFCKAMHARDRLGANG